MPAAIRLVSNRNAINADCNDLSYISVEIVDEMGNVVPYENDTEVSYSITGEGELAGVGNGNPTDISSFQQLKKKVYQGKGLVIIRPKSRTGKIVLKASAEGLTNDSITVIVQ